MAVDALRDALLAHLSRMGVLRSAAVTAAMRAVPRHRFVPDLPPEDAYADRAIAIKAADDDVISSLSQPAMIAQMLELLAPCAGQRVLEIGTGSGYNAALLAELVGPSGSVTTVELEPDLAGAAAGTLAQLGYENVAVIRGDGSAALPDGTRYDRIEVSARSHDVADAWWRALTDGGRIVVPLRLESAGEYAVGFIRDGNRLNGIGVHPCAFIALRGQGADSGEGPVFHRDQNLNPARVRELASVVAVRREDATPDLIEIADVILARPITIFALRLKPPQI
jgi:protein-L-isoaspartate(D-aspartate) O-methyltransferase